MRIDRTTWGLYTGSKILCRVHLYKQEEIYFKIRQVAFYRELFGLLV